MVLQANKRQTQKLQPMHRPMKYNRAQEQIHIYMVNKCLTIIHSIQKGKDSLLSKWC